MDDHPRCRAWNGAPAQNAGLGDTRPFTIATINDGGCHITSSGHFAPVDYSPCHHGRTGIVTGATTTTQLQGRWTFPRRESRMTNPGTCNLCHGSPNNCSK